MAGPSKVPHEDEHVQKKVSGSTLSSIMYTGFKKVVTVGVVYLVGYMNWSVAWLIGPVVWLVLRDQWRKEHATKVNIAKAAALANEKDVILARVDELPAWVYFPDVERAEWVNRILHQVWPNVNHFTRDLLRDKIGPSVAKSLEKYKLSGFKFERMIMGNIPPRVGGVKVYDRNISRNEIIMDVDLFYAGDCDINFAIGGIRGGIKDFQIHGMIRVVMKPLITTMPLVGGLQVFFLNNPTIDFNLVGVADLLDMPGLSDMLRKIIIEQVAAMMVLPNKLPIQLSKDIEAAELKTPEPEGVLRVHVVEAKHLEKKDIGILGKGKSDPYAILNVGAQEFRTKTINNTVDPKWDYWCEFTILESSGQQVFVHLWDLDDLSKADEPLGRATVEVENVAKKGEEDMWVTLEQCKHGMVHLKMTWFSLSSNYSDLKHAIEETQLLRVTSMSTALLTVYIDSAKKLPQARTSKNPDPYVIMSVGSHRQQTTVEMRSTDPVWEQGFTFLVANPESDTLHFRIADHKTDVDLGHLTYNLSGLSEKTNLEMIKQPFGLMKSGPESKLVLSLSLRILKKQSIGGSGSEANEEEEEKGKLIRKDSNMSSSSSGSVHKPAPSADENSSQTGYTINRQPSGLESTGEVEEFIEDARQSTVSATPPGTPTNTLIHRNPSITSSSGDAKLGRVQVTLRYSVQRERLIVVIHKIANLPMKDPSNIPDPYVKLYLLPDRHRETKRKTPVMKDNCNPVYDENFEYLISQGELHNQQLEITVVTQKKLFYSSSNVMGQVIVDLSKFNLTEPYTAWHDLQPEVNRE